jgi:hypothetical protein
MSEAIIRLKFEMKEIEKTIVLRQEESKELSNHLKKDKEELRRLEHRGQLLIGRAFLTKNQSGLTETVEKFFLNRILDDGHKAKDLYGPHTQHLYRLTGEIVRSTVTGYMSLEFKCETVYTCRALTTSNEIRGSFSETQVSLGCLQDLKYTAAYLRDRPSVSVSNSHDSLVTDREDECAALLSADEIAQLEEKIASNESEVEALKARHLELQFELEIEEAKNPASPTDRIEGLTGLLVAMRGRMQAIESQSLKMAARSQKTCEELAEAARANISTLAKLVEGPTRSAAELESKLGAMSEALHLADGKVSELLRKANERLGLVEGEGRPSVAAFFQGGGGGESASHGGDEKNLSLPAGGEW